MRRMRYSFAPVRDRAGRFPHTHPTGPRGSASPRDPMRTIRRLLASALAATALTFALTGAAHAVERGLWMRYPAI